MAVRNREIMKLSKFLTIAVCGAVILTLLIIPIGQGHARAQLGYSFISEPSKIPYLSDWETPVIEPGDKGSMVFTITNRYYERNLRSNNLTDVALTLGIYKYATIYNSKSVNNNFEGSPKISKILSTEWSNPDIVSETTGIITVEPKTNITLYRIFWNNLPVNTSCRIELEIKTHSNTPEGTYFIKSELVFDHSGIENRSFTMRSLGHYSKSEWNHAKNTAADDFAPGINLTVLGIDGIIPESSFSVRYPIPSFPTYIFIGLAIFFAIMAGVFYYMEEHNKFPKLKEKLDGKKK